MLANCAVFELALILALPLFVDASDLYPDCRTPTLKNNLLGPVRSVRTETSEANGENRKLNSRETFDRAGRLVEEWHTSLVGDPEREGYQVFRYIYEPQGRDYKLDMFEIDPAQGEEPMDVHRYFVKFDSLGQCVEEATVDSDGSLEKKTYEYDGQGNLIDEIYHHADGTVSSVERTYGQNHELLSEKGIGWSSDFSRAYRHDARGDGTDEFYYKNDRLEAHRVFQYDDRNRVISSETIVDPSKDARVYGRCGDCGFSSGKTIYTYDDAIGTVKEEMFEPGNKLVSTQYDFYATDSNQSNSPPHGALYDSHGNWMENESSQSRRDLYLPRDRVLLSTDDLTRHWQPQSGR